MAQASANPGLAKALETEKDPKILSRLARENNFGIIQVHPFYGRFLVECTQLRAHYSIKPEYKEHEKKAVSAMAQFQQDGHSQAICILEDPACSIECAKRAFEEHGAIFEPVQEPIYAPRGWLLKALGSGLDALDHDGREPENDWEDKQALAKNRQTNAASRLFSLILEKNGLLAFGLYDGECVLRVCSDARLLAAALAKKTEDFAVVVNRELTKSAGEIQNITSYNVSQVLRHLK